MDENSIWMGPVPRAMLDQLREQAERLQIEADKLDELTAELVDWSEQERVRAEQARTPKPHPCTRCGTTMKKCDDSVFRHSKACCQPCALTDTHGDTIEQAVARRQAWRPDSDD